MGQSVCNSEFPVLPQLFFNIFGDLVQLFARLIFQLVQGYSSALPVNLEPIFLLVKGTDGGAVFLSLIHGLELISILAGSHSFEEHEGVPKPGFGRFEATALEE